MMKKPTSKAELSPRSADWQAERRLDAAACGMSLDLDGQGAARSSHALT
jgi:hypothetical protein